VSEARAAILGRLRAALPRDTDGQAAAEAEVARRLAHPSPNLIPARGQLGRDERIELFISQARAVQTDVERLPALEAVPGAVSAYLRQHNLPQKIVVAPEPTLDATCFDRQPFLRVRRGTAEASDLVGLTLAAAGIAETGTLMLVSSETTPTLLAFLPETSVVVLAADDVDASYEASWARLREALGSPPRSVNLITGPSRTGDIAQKIELGAHGPRRLLILLVEHLASHGPAGDGDSSATASAGAGAPTL
jgi:L-lactate dehydrogenase complex protein LldG